MAREIPVLVRAAAGLAATVLDEARKLPEILPGLPVRVIGLAMQRAMKIQQHYAGFVARGDELFTGLRGEDEPGLATFDDDEDEPAPTPGFRDSAFDRAGDSLLRDIVAEDDLGDLLDDPEADVLIAEAGLLSAQVEEAQQTIGAIVEEAPGTEEVLEELAIEEMVADAPAADAAVTEDAAAVESALLESAGAQVKRPAVATPAKKTTRAQKAPAVPKAPAKKAAAAPAAPAKKASATKVAAKKAAPSATVPTADAVRAEASVPAPAPVAATPTAPATKATPAPASTPATAAATPTEAPAKKAAAGAEAPAKKAAPAQAAPAKATPATTAPTTATPSSAAPATPPIDGYDDFSIAQLRGHLRGYAQKTVEELLTYEEAGLSREPYLRMLRNRLERLRSDSRSAGRSASA